MPRTIDRDEVQRLMNQGAQLIDVLPKKEYGESHLPQAINITLQSLDEEATRSIAKGQPSLSIATIIFALISDHYHPWIKRQGHSPFVWSVIGPEAGA